MLLELAGEAGGEGPLTDLGTGSGLLAIAAAKLGWGPVAGFDHEADAVEAAIANAEANGVDVEIALADLRMGLPDLAPTVVANMTAPVLRIVAAHMTPEGGGGRKPAGARPAAMVCSGLLPGELDEIGAAFSAAGLREVERRREGDWAALLLRA